MLGVLPGVSRPTTDLELDSDDWSLLMYTDGLIEGRIGDGDERLDVDGLCALLSDEPGRDGRWPTCPRWLVGQAEERNGGPLADDVAMLLLTAGGGR